MAKKSKKRRELPVTGSLAQIALNKVVALYVFMMLAIYPLYYQDKYFNMGEAKWIFFKNVSLVFLVLAGVAFLWYAGCFLTKKEMAVFIQNAKAHLCITDYFVFAYITIAFISTIISPFQEMVWVGYDGWYMGFLSQLSFVLIYLFVSRCWRWDGPAILAYLGVAVIVFFFGIIMRFHIDPMEMYTGLEEKYILNFISTLGQTTWYSSYMTIIFPLGMYAFWLYDEKWKRIVFGLFTAISFMTLVTQNSDSAYLGLAGIFFMLFWISMESNKGIVRMLEVWLIALGSFKLMGILEVVFADNMVQLDTLSVFFSQSMYTWIALVVVALFYLLARKFLVYDIDDSMLSSEENISSAKGFDVSRHKKIRWVILGILIFIAVILLIYIYLNSTWQLPWYLYSYNNYLRFNILWGNKRGVSWMAACYALTHCDIVRILFGAGPDCFAQFVYSFEECAKSLTSMFGENTILTCCHNEWLNAFVNVGLFGGIAYLGIFISSIRRCMLDAKNHPEVYAVVLSISGYICHNLFCYQQIICTPLIFLVMGAAEAVIRYGNVFEE